MFLVEKHKAQSAHNKQPTYVLCLVHMLNTLPLCLTAAAGTEFARDFLFDISTRVLAYNAKRSKAFSGNFPKKKYGLRQFAFPRNLFIPYLTQKCMIRLSPIVKYSSLLPLMRMGLVSVPLWPFPRSGRLWIFGLGFCTIPTT